MEDYINFYHILFIVFLVITILLALLAGFLFFRLRIPKVFGELSGITAKKEIAAMRKAAAMQEDRLGSGNSTPGNSESASEGYTDDLEGESTNRDGKEAEGLAAMANAERAERQENSAPVPAEDAGSVRIPETELRPLDQDESETMPLSAGTAGGENWDESENGGTRVLALDDEEDQTEKALNQTASRMGFVITRQVMIVHTEQQIT